MSFWFTEKHTPTRGLSFQIDASLFTQTSPFQKMEIVQTPDFGKVMLLDDVVMVTERDEFVYHEMITHVALYTHPHPRRVLIIGGGDGGTLREVTRHPEVEEAVLVEIDELVIRGAKMYFPQLAQGFESPKAKVIVGDGIRYLKETTEMFDIILIDSTDPVGPAEGLFNVDFYRECHRHLNADGILTVQSESPYLDNHLTVIRRMNQDFTSLFHSVHPYIAAIQTYQTGLWSFQLCSKRYHPIHDFRSERYTKNNLPMKYYNEEIHQACFALPEFYRQALNRD